MCLFLRSLVLTAAVVGVSSASAATIDSLYRQKVLSLLPVAYWELDEASGSPQAIDTISPQANGSASGISLGNPSVFPAFSSAAEFDTTASINVGNPAKLQTGAFSLSFWMNPGAADRSMITKGTSRSSAGNRTWDVFGNGSNLIFNGSDGSSFIFSVSTAFPTLGDWHMVTATWDGTTGANGVKLYVNDQLAAQGASSSTALTSSAFDVFIGGSGSWMFDGLLDEVAIFNYALPEADVVELYSLGGSLVAPPVIPEPSTSVLVLLGLAAFAA